MATINRHGLKMIGLKAASGDTKYLRGYYSGHYCELFYNRSSGRVWTTYQYSLGHNSWTEYHDRDVIACGILTTPTTMQEIADLISGKLSERQLAEAC